MIAKIQGIFGQGRLYWNGRFFTEMEVGQILEMIILTTLNKLIDGGDRSLEAPYSEVTKPESSDNCGSPEVG